ncbi:hypothetical protein GOB57_22205 [Sinorhizobium meliloti]|nr:hypothetical protein [Sinorhizobium meliloti]
MVIRDDILALAVELIDELATEIDLHYEDHELKDAGPAVASIEKLQGLLVSPPSETYVHILERYRKATSA